MALRSRRPRARMSARALYHKPIAINLPHILNEPLSSIWSKKTLHLSIIPPLPSARLALCFVFCTLSRTSRTPPSQSLSSICIRTASLWLCRSARRELGLKPVKLMDRNFRSHGAAANSAMTPFSLTFVMSIFLFIGLPCTHFFIAP